MNANVQNSTGEVEVIVTPEMTAALDGVEIHPVYSTFWLAYHAEVASRRAIAAYFEGDENAVGSGLQLTHLAMAGVGARVRIVARVETIEGRRIQCSIEARVLPSGTLLATGTQDQVVLPQQVLTEKVRQAAVT